MAQNLDKEIAELTQDFANWAIRVEALIEKNNDLPTSVVKGLYDLCQKAEQEAVACKTACDEELAVRSVRNFHP